MTSLLYEHVLEHKYVCGDFLRYLSKEKNISYGDLLDIVKKLQNALQQGMFSLNLQDKIGNILEVIEKYDTEYKIFQQKKVVSNIEYLNLLLTNLIGQFLLK